MDEEALIWEGHPSQWTNFPLFVACLLVVPIPFALWRWLETRCHTFRITTQRVVVRRGVFSKRTEELELYRVKDTTLVEPFWLRLVGLGNVLLATSDRSSPELLIRAVPGASALRESLRQAIEKRRTAKGIREVDVGDVHS